jgi:catechol 2,3-dioxygenase-like lactoylglutathione lyase family enzyme
VSRVQLALNVPNIDQAVDFYSKLFAAEPDKRRPGYANFAIADPPLKLVLFENPGAENRLNHLGVEVADSNAVWSAQQRLAEEGIGAADGSGTCCFAEQDKVWVDAPDGAWEIYTVLADSPTFGQDRLGEGENDAEAMAGCCAAGVDAAGEGAVCCG